MENIIPISRSNGFEYSVVLLRKKAEKIRNENNMLFYCSDGLWYGRDLPENSELIGSLEDLTEDQAREIVESENGQYYDYNQFRGHLQNYVETALESLKSLIESKGIKTENPLKKPYLNDPKFCGEHGSIDRQGFIKDVAAWEASERELKKILILKTKI